MVTHYDPEWDDVFVNDRTGGVFLVTEGSRDFVQGQLVQVTGFSGVGEFAPVVMKARLRVLGQGRLPRPRRVTYQDLFSGTLDSEFVEVQGTIRSAVLDKNRLNLYLKTGAGHLRATVVNVHSADLERLVSAQVTLRGACGSTFTKRGQLTGIIIHVQSLHDVIIREPRHEPLEAPLAHVCAFAS